MLSYREPRGRTVWVQSYSTLLVPKDRLWKGNTKYLESVLLPHSEVASIPAVGLSHKVDSNESVSATSCWLVAASLMKAPSMSRSKPGSSEVPLLWQCGISSASSLLPVAAEKQAVLGPSGS